MDSGGVMSASRRKESSQKPQTLNPTALKLVGQETAKKPQTNL